MRAGIRDPILLQMSRDLAFSETPGGPMSFARTQTTADGSGWL